MATSIKCVKCGKTRDFNEYTLTEEATLICPNCKAEFSLTATLEKVPGGEEGGLPPEAEFTPSPTLSPELSAEAPPPELPLPGEEEESIRRESGISVHVLTCSKCRAEWVGAFRKTCPTCGSEDILASKRTTTERVTSMLDELEHGVPVKRALSKLFGLK